MKFLTVLYIVLIIMLILVLAVIVCSIIELGRFRVIRYKIDKNIPEFLKGKKLIFISDYHEACNGRLNDQIVDAVRKINPYLILLGGDMVNSCDDPQATFPAVSLINDLASVSDVVYAFGNHEDKLDSGMYGFKSDISAFTSRLKNNVTILRNDKYYINKTDDKDGVIYGLDLPLDFYQRFTFPELTVNDINGFIGEKGNNYSILLGHPPDLIKGYSEWGADLILSGHFHGGIVRIPWIGGVISPRLRLFPKYDYGMYSRDNSQMIVTNGLGQHSIKIRLNNVPEIVCIEFI